MNLNFMILALIVVLIISFIYFQFRPYNYFRGAVEVNLTIDRSNQTIVVLVFHRPGRYHVGFIHPKFKDGKGPESISANQTVLVKQTPYTLEIKRDWIPLPLRVEITFEQKTEVHIFN